jgi:hypothetical protein
MAALSAAALAQPETTVSTPPAGQAEPAQPDKDALDELGKLLASVRTTYRKGLVAERVTLRVSREGREAGSSTITLLIDNGVPDLSWPRRVRLELGRLSVYADDKNLVAVNAQDPGTYFTAALPEGLTLAALRGVLPPIPLPQLEWSLSDSDAATDLSHMVPGAGAIVWGPCISESRAHQFTFVGEAAGGPVQLTLDSVAATLVHISAPYGPKSTSGQARLDIDVAPVPPEEIPPAEQWPIATTGRVPVGFIAELKGRPPEIVTGDRIPALSLMNAELGSASLQDLLTPANQLPVQAARPAFGALILYRVQDAAPTPEARAGVKAIEDLRSVVAARWPEAAKRPRIAGLVVACLDLQEFNRARLADIDKEWGTANGSPDRAFSPTGSAILSRLAQKAGAALVIVDADQKVLKAIPLDGRASEDEAIAQEAFDSISAALSPP